MRYPASFLLDKDAVDEEQQYKTNTFIVSVEEGAYYADDVYVEVQFRDIAEKSAENPLWGVADSRTVPCQSLRRPGS